MSFEQELIHRLEAADAVELAQLIAGATAEQERVLRVYLGDERFRRMREKVALRSLTSRKRAVQGNVVVIHGIMGAELSAYQPGDDDLLWVSIPRIIFGGLDRLRLLADGVTDATSGWKVRASGILKKYYGELMLWLADDWTVKPFFFDWRKSLDLAAAELNDRILEWFGKGKPVHLVAHSMGGLVSRTFIANHSDTWKRMWDEPGAGRMGGRLVMLGTPNHGSFAMTQMITGIEPLVRKLEKADLAHDLSALRLIFNSFPGSLQMLPSPFKYGSLRPLYDAKTYGALGISQSHLTAAFDHHAKLQTVIEPDRMTYIAGTNQPTFGYVDPTLETISNVNAYAVTKEGDGRVPHVLGLLDKVTTYFVKTDHGGLSEKKPVFSVISDLLDRGKSNVFPTRLPVVTASPRSERQRALRVDLSAALDTEMAQVEAMAARRRPRAAMQPNEVIEDDRRAEEIILRGILGDGAGLELNGAPFVVSTGAVTVDKFNSRKIHVGVRLAPGSIELVDGLVIAGLPVDAVAIGHYIGVQPQAAEKVIDDALSTALFSRVRTKGPWRGRGVIAEFTDQGILRGALGEQFFINDPRPTKPRTGPRLISLVGLGEPGHLGVPELTVAIRALCWSLGRLGKQHLATVLIGSGSGNLSIADAVNAWMRGARRALVEGGVRPRRPRAQGGFGLRRITFIESDPGRIKEIAEALEEEQNRQRGAGLDIDLILPNAGEQTRWIAQSRKEHARRGFDKAGIPPSGGGDPPPTVVTVSQDKQGYVFAALTESASIPERSVAVDHALVFEANQRLACARDTLQQRRFGRTLWNLIVPRDLSPHLRSSAPLVMVVDATTARLHWEMMADGEPDGETSDAFLATGRGLTRRLRTAFAPPPEPPPAAARILRVLVVADPAGDARLPGAAREGMEVANLFERFNDVYASAGHHIEVTRLFGPEEASRLSVLVALTERRYDVLHFAGHCVFDPENVSESGWIFTGGKRLTARELNRIDRIPPFIFSNACESGITPERATARPVAAAPSFAEAFFARGVSNFVCTAWEIDDEAALQFATLFYTQLLGLQNWRNKNNKGRFTNIAEALRIARSTISEQERGIGTWGAYQHYGTPSYRFFQTGTEDAKGRPKG